MYNVTLPKRPFIRFNTLGADTTPGFVTSWQGSGRSVGIPHNYFTTQAMQATSSPGFSTYSPSDTSVSTAVATTPAINPLPLLVAAASLIFL